MLVLNLFVCWDNIYYPQNTTPFHLVNSMLAAMSSSTMHLPSLLLDENFQMDVINEHGYHNMHQTDNEYRMDTHSNVPDQDDHVIP